MLFTMVNIIGITVLLYFITYIIIGTVTSSYIIFYTLLTHFTQLNTFVIQMRSTTSTTHNIIIVQCHGIVIDALLLPMCSVVIINKHRVII